MHWRPIFADMVWWSISNFTLFQYLCNGTLSHADYCLTPYLNVCSICQTHVYWVVSKAGVAEGVSPHSVWPTKGSFTLSKFPRWNCVREYIITFSCVHKPQFHTEFDVMLCASNVWSGAIWWLIAHIVKLCQIRLIQSTYNIDIYNDNEHWPYFTTIIK